MSTDAVLELNDENFEQETGQGVVLVDFWAPWCGPCRMQTPIVEAVAGKVEGKAKVAKVNVDEAPSVAAKFGVRSIPTIIILKDGQPAQQLVGLRQEGDLTAAIDDALA